MDHWLKLMASNNSNVSNDMSVRSTISETPVPMMTLSKDSETAPKSGAGVHAVNESGQKTIRRQFVLSLVRHGQSASNVTLSHGIITREDDANVRLTDFGKDQVYRLKKDWKDTRVDLKVSSPYIRAQITATAIPDPEEEKRSPFFEDAIGTSAYEQFHGDRRFQGGGRVGKGPNGESLNEVAARGELVIGQIARFFEYQHYIKLLMESDDRPSYTEALLECLGPVIQADGTVDPDSVRTPKCPSDLPQELLHIVLVSHNIFLAEFYELIHRWQTPDDYEQTDASYDCTSWSRHLITMEIPVKAELGAKDFMEYFAKNKPQFCAGGPGTLHVKDLKESKRFIEYLH